MRRLRHWRKGYKLTRNTRWSEFAQHSTDPAQTLQDAPHDLTFIPREGPIRGRPPGTHRGRARGRLEFAFPVALAEGLVGAPRSKLSKITLSPNGLALHWPLLDVDLYVPGLIEGAFGSRRWMQQVGKLGGQRRSAAKAKVSRENGKRGGRPRDQAVA